MLYDLEETAACQRRGCSKHNRRHSIVTRMSGAASFLDLIEIELLRLVTTSFSVSRLYCS